MTPRRVQRKRTKGWRKPDGAVYVGRPSRWGNPFAVDGFFLAAASAVLGMSDWHETAVLLHRAWMRGAKRVERMHEWDPTVSFTEGQIGGMAWLDGADIQSAGVLDLPKVPDLAPLRGRDLMCWCPLGRPCHADVLLEIANQ